MKTTIKDLLDAAKGDDSVEVKILSWDEHQTSLDEPAGFYRALVAPLKYLMIVSTRPEDEGATMTDFERDLLPK